VYQLPWSAPAVVLCNAARQDPLIALAHWKGPGVRACSSHIVAGARFARRFLLEYCATFKNLRCGRQGLLKTDKEGKPTSCASSSSPTKFLESATYVSIIAQTSKTAFLIRIHGMHDDSYVQLKGV
jgi:hypothetical protein